MMKVLICDDQALIRDGLEMLLKLEKDIEVVGQAQDGAEGVEFAAKYQFEDAGHERHRSDPPNSRPFSGDKGTGVDHL